jgi:hypothetical protein
MDRVTRWGQRDVRNHRTWGRVVEQQHDLREQPMASRQVDDAAASKEAPRTAGNLPGFVKFLPRQASRRADSAGDPIERPLRWKTPEIAPGQTAL